MQVMDYKLVEEAFAEGVITLEQFIEVLVDNFGKKATQKIIKHNIRRAQKDERKKQSCTNTNS